VCCVAVIKRCLYLDTVRDRFHVVMQFYDAVMSCDHFQRQTAIDGDTYRTGATFAATTTNMGQQAVVRQP